MRRREVITLLGGAAAFPVTARAQQLARPVIGFLHSASPTEYAHLVAAFHGGLEREGYVAGRNVTIEYRWAEGEYGRLRSLAAELVTRQVDVIVTTGGEPSALAAKAVTSTIPIVFTSGDDPIKSGLVASHNRPGGNATGASVFTTALVTKRLGLMCELLSTITAIDFLVNPNFTSTAADIKEAQEAADRLGIRIHIWRAISEAEVHAVFRSLGQRRSAALIVNTDAYFFAKRVQIVALAVQHAIPTMYYLREFVAEGGLISYGASLADSYRQVGVYTGRILKGEKPADLPVVQPTKFELVINVKTEKALGLDVPPTLLARADEVIE